MTQSVLDTQKTASRLLIGGALAVLVIVGAAALVLLISLPDANLFNEKVARLFVETDLTSEAEIRLLEILAQSGTAFEGVLASYRVIIAVLLVFGAALLAATLVFLILVLTLNRRIRDITRQGLEIVSLTIARDRNAVLLNDFEFTLTPAAIETLAVLAEARLDDDILTGAEIEAMISGRIAADCDEAAGATRIKRLRDALGSQIVGELLVRNVARKGYVLSVDKKVLRIS
jgi:DNA-binding winged helix-turn-helix (wHTH) protein